MKKSGIYRIVNTVNNRVYVGSAINLENRKEEHWRKLRYGRHVNGFLQESWDECGSDQFSFHVIEYVDDKTKLVEREQFYLNQLSFDNDDPNRCYNICRVAGSLLGTKRTVESRALMAAMKIGRKLSPETIAKQAAKMRGRKKSLESIAKRTMSRAGFRHSDEAKAKMSATRTGMKMSPETRAKMSAAKKGKSPTEAHKLALRESNRSFTAEQVAEMVRRRLTGDIYADIAKDFNTTKDTVRNWCLREGLGKGRATGKPIEAPDRQPSLL